MKTKSTLEDKVIDSLSHSSLFSFSIKKTQYPWSKLFGELGPRDHNRTVDIYVPSFNVILEIQGAQHYNPVTFGGSIVDAKARYERQVSRDNRLRRFVDELGDHILIDIDAKTVRRNDEETLAKLIDSMALELMDKGEHYGNI